ncbi:ABC transporter ATP-binding protein [Cellulomonas palmilytica]|uniref:ABC transporter ATP-binding protein n=1 Tax=Cellulomonas palmilytica TaxID=2608402 RepID=UPI001F3012EF|nr:ATP-binding cassette domain-containing protein [Cellulomonas palmilytica]UJP39744.1 ATP-binding cassette domain-containing protein [Cellulomonas palmilytica]
MIALEDLTVRFGEHVVLDRLCLELPDGATTAVTGPNGAGKTTLARVLLGLVRPSSGRVRGLAGRARAAAFQEDRLCEQLSAPANVRLVLPRSSGDLAAEGLRAVGLDDAAWHGPVRALSGGQRRRVALVRALLPAADLVVLDEPFVGIDAASRADVLAWTRDRLAGRTALLVTHDPAEAAALGATVVRLEPARGAAGAHEEAGA